MMCDYMVQYIQVVRWDVAVVRVTSAGALPLGWMVGWVRRNAPRLLDSVGATRREIPRGLLAPSVLADRLGWGLQVVACAAGGKQQKSSRRCAPRLTADGRMQTEQYEPDLLFHIMPLPPVK